MLELTDMVTALPAVGDKTSKLLEKLGVVSIFDLLTHIPHRYVDYQKVADTANITVGEVVTVRGTVSFFKNQYTKQGKQMQLMTIIVGGQPLMAVWFHQPFLVRMFRAGDEIQLSGKVDWFGRKKAFVSPEYEKVAPEMIHTGKIVPIYPETAGISSKQLRRFIQRGLKEVSFPADYLEALHTTLTLPEYKAAFYHIHNPTSTDDAEDARKRLAFDELFLLQSQNLTRKRAWETKVATQALQFTDKDMQELIQALPFTLTDGQKAAIGEVLDGLTKPLPMNRLLQGDVGSGKTVVALAAAYATYLAGYQTIVMAPTLVLANQHYKTFVDLLGKLPVRVSLVTGAGVTKTTGRADIVVGTHALLYTKEHIADAALVVIDEQHRFGVRERAKIADIALGERTPHILTMTATPIPRTVALTMYGELSVSTLSEMPKNRKTIKTWVVDEKKRADAHSWIDKEIQENKSQAYVICPLIEESEVETMKDVKAVKKEYEQVVKLHPTLRVGLLHGKMKNKEKDEVLEAFKRHELDILVSTQVVEVGIDVPNATIMVIEASERFGLSQLHQLRGRVGRGEKQSYCLLFQSADTSSFAIQRLQAFSKIQSGFELAELDLTMRGPGEVFGLKQSGYPDLKIARWTDFDLIKKAREVAEAVHDNPKQYPEVHQYLKSRLLAEN